MQAQQKRFKGVQTEAKERGKERLLFEEFIDQFQEEDVTNLQDFDPQWEEFRPRHDKRKSDQKDVCRAV